MTPLWLPVIVAGQEALVNLGAAQWVECLAGGKARVHFGSGESVIVDSHFYCLRTLLAVRAEAGGE